MNAARVEPKSEIRNLNSEMDITPYSSLLAPYDKGLVLYFFSCLKARRAAPQAAEGVAVSTGGAYAPEQLKGEEG